MKRIFSLFLAAATLFVSTGYAFATDNSAITDGTIKVAYIQNVNETGSNIGTDQSNPNAILDPNEYSIAFSLDFDGLSISGSWDNVQFLVSGNVVTTNENRNLLLYESVDSLGNYTVAYVAVERELDETALFFTSARAENLSHINVIKLYMQPQNTNALLLIEIFLPNDFVATMLNARTIAYDNEAANRIQCWYVNYYGPIPNSTGMVQPRANTAYETLDLSKTYYLNGIRVTTHFVVRLYYTVANLVKGGSAVASCYFYIAESRTSSDLAANNSSTQSYLRLYDLNVKFSPMPYVICISQEPYRHEIRNNWGFLNTSFSVSFGFNYGFISASGNLNFNDSEDMDTDETPLPYTTTYGVKGTESGVLPSNLYISKQGAYYGMKVDYMDSGEYARSGTMHVEFSYFVNNMYDYTESFRDTFEDSFTVSVM